MGRPTPNEVLLLDQRLAKQKVDTYPEATDDEHFLISSVDTLLRRRELSYQQIEEGITEGADDGGIDAVFTFVNDTLVEDESVSVSRPDRIDLEIVQAKNERGHKEMALQRLIDHLPQLLQLDPPKSLSVEFSERLLERFSVFRKTYLSGATAFPDVSITVHYVSKATEEPHSKVAVKRDRLIEAVKGCFADAQVTVSLVGAAELNARSRERISNVLELRMAEGPLSSEKGGLVCLVTLDEWFRFISESDRGRIREDIFEENVRGYEGETVINKGIATSLRQGADEQIDFWWLNNGVTLIGTKVMPGNKRLVIDDPQVVNGLQTSRNIYQYLSTDTAVSNDGTDRHLLVRVIETTDDSIASQVIKATNSQNRVSSASLRSAEPFQRNIEEFLRGKGYFYERKKNQYKNQQKPRSQIVEVLELAQAVGAILLREPHIARGKPSALVRDPNYGKVFKESTPLQAFLKCLLIVRNVDEFLEGGDLKLNRQMRSNVRFHLARSATAFALGSSRPKASMLAKIEPAHFDAYRLGPVYDWLMKSRDDVQEEMGVSDLNIVAKGSDWSRDIDRRLSRYTEKTRWPKIIMRRWQQT